MKRATIMGRETTQPRSLLLFTDLITRLLIPARLHSNPSIALTPATANSFRLREAAAAMAAEAMLATTVAQRRDLAQRQQHQQTSSGRYY